MSYNFGTVVRAWTWAEVGQRLDRGWRGVGERVITEVSTVEKN